METDPRNCTAIDGSLIPSILKGIAQVLESHRDPTTVTYVFDSNREELRVTERDTTVLHTIDY